MARWNPYAYRRMMGSRSNREQPGFDPTASRQNDVRRLMSLREDIRPQTYGSPSGSPPILPPAAAYPGAGPQGAGPGSGMGQLGTSAVTPPPGSPGAPGGFGDIGSPYTDFATPFSTSPSVAGMIFDNPQIALMQAMKNAGYDPSGGQNTGLYQMMLPDTDYANALAMIALGGTPGGYGAGANNAVINFMGDYLGQGLAPGGQAINFNQGLAALNAGAGASGSPLGQFLNVEDPTKQISNYKSLALPLAASSLHPLFARAFQNALNMAGDQYLYNMAGPNMGAGAGGFGSFLGGQGVFG